MESDLEARFAGYGPWSEGPTLGPYRLWLGRGASALTGGAARLSAWRTGWERARGSALCPVPIAHEPNVVLLDALGAPADPVAALLAQPREARVVRGTRRELLAGLDAEVSLPRALGRVGLKRRHVDRWLNATIEEVADHVDVSFGGPSAAAWRAYRGRVACARCDLVRRDAWRALDLAGVGLEEEGEVAAIARLAVALRAAARAGRTERALRVAAAIVRPEPSPEAVRVWIEGPDAIAGLWEPPGATVDASRARWLLAHVDGLGVAGARVRVRTEPRLRAGRRAPPREPRAARRRRLFSRWDEGVRVDDEGLVGLTPEALAEAIAARARGVVIDGTCGVGGLAIALARAATVERVIAVDVSAERLAMARHNAGVYGVADRIDFVRGDVRDVVRERAADTLVLDPPWGGRDYDRERVTLDALGLDVGAVLAAFDGPVLLKLPRSFDVATLPPGDWTHELMLDAREIPKLLLATRAATSR